MNADVWVTFLHDGATILTTVAAAIAAASSVKNGQVLKQQNKVAADAQQDQANQGKNATPADDWFKPPDLK